MNKTIVMLAAAAALMGCGATARSNRASIPQHRWSEGDWYADALDDAVGAYEAEVELAASRWYDGEVEAGAVAVTHGEGRFDMHLARALHARGLTRRGLRVYGARHPEFVEAQRARVAPRMDHVRRIAATIARRVDPDVRGDASFIDAADGRVAVRE